VQIHEVVMVMPDDSMGSDTTMGGMDMGTDTTMGMDMGTDDTMPSGEMTMQQVEFIELPAGTAVELKPGGYHVMIIGLVNPLEVGQTIQITLVFEKAGEITIDVPVLEEAPTA
ncbi:MAG: copper chaperone PCu(A)C, partial [Ilumatobacter sp.]|nr:copper chaperone PCu(A)C [Ilumatobacter sp.]